MEGWGGVDGVVGTADETWVTIDRSHVVSDLETSATDGGEMMYLRPNGRIGAAVI